MIYLFLIFLDRDWFHHSFTPPPTPTSRYHLDSNKPIRKNSNRWSSVKHSENNIIIIIKEYSDYFCSFFVLRERCLSVLWYGKVIWKVEPKPVSLSSFALNWFFFFSLIFSLFSPQALPVYLFCFDPCLSVCNMKMCFVCANRSRSLSMVWCRWWWSRENSLCVCVCVKSFLSLLHCIALKEVSR